MSNPMSRAVASVALAAACAAIAFAAPDYGSVAVIGLVAGLYFVWEGA